MFNFLWYGTLFYKTVMFIPDPMKIASKLFQCSQRKYQFQITDPFCSKNIKIPKSSETTVSVAFTVYILK